MARPGGVEPPAKSLEGSCSVHLSYGRMLDAAVGVMAHHYRENAF